MTVVLSGDVHHAISSSDQRFTDRSEAALAAEYSRIAARHGLKVTLFLTGRAMLEDGADARPLLTMENVEIGGHGWDAFQPQWRYKMLNRVLGSPHGSAWVQGRMVRRTCDTLERYSGRPVPSWRNHAYTHDQRTPRVLAQAGIRAWSDEVNLERIDPYLHASGVVVLPINTLPDHEHLYHGARTRESVAAEGRGVSYQPDAWCDQVCTQVDRIVSAGGVATVLAHPICMKVADGWLTFERLCAFVSKYRSVWASEAVQPLL